MATGLDNLEYKKSWHDLTVDYYEGYRSNMASFHMHEYYEISLILSGEVRVLLSDRLEEGRSARLVMTGPGTPHFISSAENILYRRLNLLFSEELIDSYLPEWQRFLSLFGSNGRIIEITDAQCALYQQHIEGIREEADPFRRKLLLLYFLSLIAEVAHEEAPMGIPPYVTGALTYIHTHYKERIVAAELAERLRIGRTTLMTALRRYTGHTLHDHLLRCRLKHATQMLRGGATEQAAAAACGFGDTPSLIRGFRRAFAMTPRQYLARRGEE
jgi:AraC-like DNA-binding protein